jgi:hypothetical protein
MHPVPAAVTDADSVFAAVVINGARIAQASGLGTGSCAARQDDCQEER